MKPETELETFSLVSSQIGEITNLVLDATKHPYANDNE